MMEKQEKELSERQSSWPSWQSWALSIASTLILSSAALAGGAAIFFWEFESECPKATVGCEYVVRRPGLLFLGIYALVCVALTLWKMIRAMRTRDARERRTALVFLAVTLAFALSILGVPFLDALFDEPYFPPPGG